MITQTDTTVGGNTKAPHSRARRWCLTYNNYNDDIYNTITQIFKDKKWDYIIGKEVGSCGTPHLQIYIECKNAVNFNTLKKLIPCAHIEKARGTRDSNIDYCSKDGCYVSTFKETVKTRKEKTKVKLLSKLAKLNMFDWEKDIIKTIESEPDDRTVNWIWSHEGNLGKSIFCMWLYLHYEGVIIADGRRTDVYNQVLKYIDEIGDPKIVLVDIPRWNFEKFNYGTIEKLKNGLIYSGKYEGGICCFCPVHVFIFANYEPDYEKFSMDRWHVVNIDKKKENDPEWA